MEDEIKAFVEQRKCMYIKITEPLSLQKIHNLFFKNIIVEPDESIEYLYFGWFFHYDINSVNNYDLMKKYYLMAIDMGNSTAMNNLGTYYYKKDNDLMKKYYLMAIENGNSMAMASLGNYYMDVETDYDLMKKYYLMAIENGNSTPMAILGSYYMDVEINYDLMKKYYLMALNDNQPIAAVHLETYYWNNLTDLSVIELYDNKHFHNKAKHIINAIFENNCELPEQYKQSFANLKLEDDEDLTHILKIKQYILKKTNIWPSNYNRKYLFQFMELLSVSASSNNCLSRDIILHIAGCLFI